MNLLCLSDLHFKPSHVIRVLDDNFLTPFLEEVTNQAFFITKFLKEKLIKSMTLLLDIPGKRIMIRNKYWFRNSWRHYGLWFMLSDLQQHMQKSERACMFQHDFPPSTLEHTCQSSKGGA